jgi:hypothetical protein
MDFAHWLMPLWTGAIFYALGTIWIAQIVVYPLFGKVGAGEYVRSTTGSTAPGYRCQS